MTPLTPDSLIPWASPAHEHRWAAVGNRDMSSPLLGLRPLLDGIHAHPTPWTLRAATPGLRDRRPGWTARIRSGCAGDRGVDARGRARPLGGCSACSPVCILSAGHC